MKNPFKKSTAVPEVEACEKAMRDAELSLGEANSELARASRIWIQSPTSETKKALDSAQHKVTGIEQRLVQCELAIEDAKREHADKLAAASAAQVEQVKKDVLNACPSLRLKAEKASEDLTSAIKNVFELAKECHELTTLAYDYGLTDGVLVGDSLLSTARIIGYLRAHLRKQGGAGQSMTWAYPWFDDLRDLPAFDKSISDGLNWLTKRFDGSQSAPNSMPGPEKIEPPVKPTENRPVVDTGIEATKRPKKPRISLGAQP